MSREAKLGLPILTAMVVGNMVGSGIFMLPRLIAEVASPAGALLAWLFTGGGVLALAYIFGSLAVRKPELSGGPQQYARALFGRKEAAAKMSAYAVSWGYWVANWSGNVAIITTFASYLSTFFPVMTNRAVLFQIGSFPVRAGNLLTFAICSVLLWGVHSLILRGIEEAGRINLLATGAKVLGFLLFITVSLFAFDRSNILPFEQPVTLPSGETIGLWGQLNAGVFATLWAFVGMESAVVFSSRARRPDDIRKATVIGLFTALIIYIGITILVMAAMPRSLLTNSEKPLVDTLSFIVGPSGSYMMAGLGLVSLFGSAIGWVLLSAEIAFQAAKQGLFPRLFLRENKRGAPVAALIVTNSLAQAFLLSTLSQSLTKAFSFITFVATLSSLLPYALAAVYHLKLVRSGETYLSASGKQERIRDGTAAVIATVYAFWVIRTGTANLQTFLFGAGLLVLGLLLYPVMTRGTDKR
ncbi:amino acid permease [Paenibacillus sp. MBLB4367]|uniref:amino acid permease n=1 Tax=Paenibacillus sp. MBLB4367 TaxID=3384767 RepID=UPI0039083E3B